MTNEEIVGEVLIKSSSEFQEKLQELADTAKSKNAIKNVTIEMLDKIDAFLATSLKECEQPNMPPELIAKRSMETIKAVVSFIKSTKIALAEDAAHSRGMYEGLQLTINALRESGEAKVREGRRIRELAESDANLEGRRKAGERPETLRVKRKAAALRESITTPGDESFEGNE